MSAFSTIVFTSCSDSARGFGARIQCVRNITEEFNSRDAIAVWMPHTMDISHRYTVEKQLPKTYNYLAVCSSTRGGNTTVVEWLA